ncbi:hypothetical protein D3C76_1264480 [compost metagenome]
MRLLLLRLGTRETRCGRLTPTASGRNRRRGALRLGNRFRIACSGAKDTAEETPTAVAGTARSLGLRTRLLEFGFQLLVLLVETLDRSFLNQNRLGHVVRRRRLLTQMLLDACLGLGIARLARIFGLLDAAEQAIDYGLFFSVHEATSWEAGQRTRQRWGVRA